MLGDIQDAKSAFGVMRRIALGLRDAEILIISAFLTVDGLRTLLSDISPTNRVRILVRWQPGDLATGASDLASFSFADERGWQFFANQSLHAKAYALGDAAIFIGSANLTRRGFSLPAVDGNVETVTQVPVTFPNLRFLTNMFANAISIDQKLVEQAREWLDCYSSVEVANRADNAPIWPLDLKERTLSQSPPTSLTVSECFLTDGAWLNGGTTRTTLTLDQEHDLSLLGQVELAHRSAIARAIQQTKIFRWFVYQLAVAGENQLYFGAITAKLHDALIDDPRPYRRDVKTLVAHLFSWMRAYPECGVNTDRPNYSERARLVLA